MLTSQVSLSSPQPSPTPKNECNKLIGLCDITIDKYKKAAEAKDSAIADLDAKVKEQQKLNDEIKSSADAWYKSPILWGVVGLIVGVVIVDRVH